MKKELLLSLLAGLAANGLSAENLTREQIDQLLADLAEKPAPKDLDPGAMCYTMRFDFMREEYNCPICGGKTIFPKGERWALFAKTLNIPAKIKELRNLGLDIKADERAWCNECRVKMEPVPNPGDIFIEITFNEKTTRTLLVYNDEQKDVYVGLGESFDFIILKAFLEGKSVWTVYNGRERPLQPELPRIRQLLGLDEPKSETPAEEKNEAKPEVIEEPAP